MSYVLLGAVALLAIFNVVATIAVWRSESAALSQKLLQTLLVWILPILGASLVWSLNRPIRSERVTTDLADRFGSDDNDIRPGNDAADVGGLGSSGDGGGH